MSISLSMGLSWLYPLLRDKTPHQKNLCPAYDTKLHLLMRLQFWRSGLCGVSLLDIIPRTTLTQSRNIFQGPIYRSNRSIWKLLVLDKNAWYQVTVCTLFVSRIVTWRYIYLQKIIIFVLNYITVFKQILNRSDYLKPYICL